MKETLLQLRQIFLILREEQQSCGVCGMDDEQTNAQGSMLVAIMLGSLEGDTAPTGH
jgi:hypothetical protein